MSYVNQPDIYLSGLLLTLISPDSRRSTIFNNFYHGYDIFDLKNIIIFHLRYTQIHIKMCRLKKEIKTNCLK